MADAKPVNPSGLSPQQRLDWQKIIENAPPGGYFDPEPVVPTIGVDTSREMVDVPPIPMLPNQTWVGTPQRMTGREAGEKQRQERLDRAAASRVYHSATGPRFGAGPGTQFGNLYAESGGVFESPLAMADPVLLAEMIVGAAEIPALLKAIPGLTGASLGMIKQFLLGSDEAVSLLGGLRNATAKVDNVFGGRSPPGPTGALDTTYPGYGMSGGLEGPPTPAPSVQRQIDELTREIDAMEPDVEALRDPADIDLQNWFYERREDLIQKPPRVGEAGMGEVDPTTFTRPAGATTPGSELGMYGPPLPPERKTIAPALEGAVAATKTRLAGRGIDVEGPGTTVQGQQQQVVITREQAAGNAVNKEVLEADAREFTEHPGGKMVRDLERESRRMAPENWVYKARAYTGPGGEWTRMLRGEGSSWELGRMSPYGPGERIRPSATQHGPAGELYSHSVPGATEEMRVEYLQWLMRRHGVQDEIINMGADGMPHIDHGIVAGMARDWHATTHVTFGRGKDLWNEFLTNRGTPGGLLPEGGAPPPVRAPVDAADVVAPPPAAAALPPEAPPPPDIPRAQAPRQRTPVMAPEREVVPEAIPDPRPGDPDYDPDWDEYARAQQDEAQARHRQEEQDLAIAEAEAQGTVEGMERAERLRAGTEDVYGNPIPRGQPVEPDLPTHAETFETRWQTLHHTDDQALIDTLTNEGRALGYSDADLQGLNDLRPVEDYYIPEENMMHSTMEGAELQNRRPPFTAEEMHQRARNEAEGEARMALLEEGVDPDTGLQHDVRPGVGPASPQPEWDFTPELDGAVGRGHGTQGADSTWDEAQADLALINAHLNRIDAGEFGDNFDHGVIEVLMGAKTNIEDRILDLTRLRNLPPAQDVVGEPLTPEKLAAVKEESKVEAVLRDMPDIVQDYSRTLPSELKETMQRMPMTPEQPPLSEAAFYKMLTEEERLDLRNLIAEYSPEEQAALARDLMEKMMESSDPTTTARQGYMLNQIIGAGMGRPWDDIRVWTDIAQQVENVETAVAPISTGLGNKIHEMAVTAGRLGGDPNLPQFAAKSEEYYDALGRFTELSRELRQRVEQLRQIERHEEADIVERLLVTWLNSID